MKYFKYLFILIPVVLNSQTFQLPATFRIRAALPQAESLENTNEWRRAYEAMFAIRPILNFGKITIMTGGEYHIGTTGSYVLETRSLVTAGGHLGLGILYQFYEIENTKFQTGFFTRRVMQQAFDVPEGRENTEIKQIIERYKIDNPGARFLYYNQHGFAALVKSPVFKVEFFLNSPLDLPLISFIPELPSGQDPHVAIVFILFEFSPFHWLIVKADWEAHSPDAKYSKLQLWNNGTGALTLRIKALQLQPAGAIHFEAGWKREIDPTGFYRNDYVFGGFRVELFGGK